MHLGILKLSTCCKVKLFRTATKKVPLLAFAWKGIYATSHDIYAASQRFLTIMRHYGIDQLYLRKVPYFYISIRASFIYEVAFKIILLKIYILLLKYFGHVYSRQIYYWCPKNFHWFMASALCNSDSLLSFNLKGDSKK